MRAARQAGEAGLPQAAEQAVAVQGGAGGIAELQAAVQLVQAFLDAGHAAPGRQHRQRNGGRRKRARRTRPRPDPTQPAGGGGDGRDTGQAVTSGPLNSGAGETRVDLGQTVPRRGRRHGRHERLTGSGREEDLSAFLCLLPQDRLSTVVGSPPPSENGLLRPPHASLPDRRTSFAAKFGRVGAVPFWAGGGSDLPLLKTTSVS